MPLSLGFRIQSESLQCFSVLCMCYPHSDYLSDQMKLSMLRKRSSVRRYGHHFQFWLTGIWHMICPCKTLQPIHQSICYSHVSETLPSIWKRKNKPSCNGYGITESWEFKERILGSYVSFGTGYVFIRLSIPLFYVMSHTFYIFPLQHKWVENCSPSVLFAALIY